MRLERWLSYEKLYALQVLRSYIEIHRRVCTIISRTLLYTLFGTTISARMTLLGAESLSYRMSDQCGNLDSGSEQASRPLMISEL